MFLSVTTNNLNWEILTKNLVTFKRWDGVKDEKLSYYAGSLKIQFKGWEGSRKTNTQGNYLKREQEGLGEFENLRLGGAWQKRGGGAFEGGGGIIDSPMHNMNLAITLTVILIY